MQELQIRRLYFSTNDVSSMAHIRPHVLRMWENRFQELRPSKSKSGRRLFKPADVKLVMLIKHLKDKGYTDTEIGSLLKKYGPVVLERFEEQNTSWKLLLCDVTRVLREVLDILQD